MSWWEPVVNVLDTPGAAIRNLLGGESPFVNPLTQDDRLSGEDMLRRLGVQEPSPLAGAAVDFGTGLLGDLAVGGIGAGVAKLLKPGVVRLGGFRSPRRRGAVYIGGGGAKKTPPTGIAALVGDEPIGEAHFYSRLEEALNALPDNQPFRSMDAVTRVTPAKTIRHPQTGEIIKEIPSQAKVMTPARSAHQQLMGYLSERAHPQEVEWVLGKQFADAPEISKQTLLDAYRQNSLLDRLDFIKHGGRDVQVWQSGEKVLFRDGSEMVTRRSDHGDRETAINDARKWAARKSDDIAERDDSSQYAVVKPIVRRIVRPEHGPLTYPNMLVPGGKNATERLIRLKDNIGPLEDALRIATDSLTHASKQYESRLSLLRQGNPRSAKSLLEFDNATSEWEEARDAVHRAEKAVEQAQSSPVFRGPHWGNEDRNVLGWSVYDDVPGTNTRRITENQSDWHQKGVKDSYGDIPRTKYEEAKQRYDSVAEQYKALLAKKQDIVNSRSGVYPVSLHNEIISTLEEKHAAETAMRRASEMLGSAIPDAPFKGTEWNKLLAKADAIDAINAGKDRVVYATPKQVSRSQGMPLQAAEKMYAGELSPEMQAAAGGRKRGQVLSAVEDALGPYGVKVEPMDTQIREKLLTGGRLVDEHGQPVPFAGTRLLSVRSHGYDIPEQLVKQARSKGLPLMSLLALAGGGGTAGIRYLLGEHDDDQERAL